MTKNIYYLCSIIFFLLCLHFATTLTLWGDEAASLNGASQSLHTILQTIDVHSPSYFILLKGIMAITGNKYENEILIRIIHILFFTVGFFFGCRALDIIFKDKRIIFFSLLFVIVMPTYIFYATNIRMYAFLFCFAMWFIDSSIYYLCQQENFSLRKNKNLLISGLLLIFTDYIGLFYYGLGSVFLLVKSKILQDKKLIIWIIIPPLFLAIIFLSNFIAAIHQVIFWPSHAVVITDLSGRIFQMMRPFMELTNLSYKTILLPLLTLVIYGLLLAYGTWLLVKRFLNKKEVGLLFLLTIAYSWLMTLILGASISRIFLPAQFFMVSIIIYALFNLKIIKQLQIAVFFGLIALNSFLALYPFHRLASRIPYHEIAINVLEAAEHYKIHSVLISGYSESYESIFRYITEQHNSEIVVQRLLPNFTEKELPSTPFLFLSFMPENNLFISPIQFEKKHYYLSVINQYLDLTQLPFNDYWKKSTLKKDQRYSYVLYLVLNKSIPLTKIK